MSPTELMVREAILKIREKEAELSSLSLIPSLKWGAVQVAKEAALRARIEELTAAVVEVVG